MYTHLCNYSDFYYYSSQIMDIIGIIGKNFFVKEFNYYEII